MQSMTAHAPVDLDKAAELGDELLKQINAQREAESISWNDSIKGWLVTGYQDVNDGFMGKKPLSCVRLQQPFAHIPKEEQERYFPHVLRAIPTWVLNSDPPSHTRLRALMMQAFSRKIVDALRPFERATLKDAFDRAEKMGRVEFINDVARRVTGKVIMNVLGIPEKYWERLEGWSWDINCAFGITPGSIETVMPAERALDEMEAIFAEQIEIRRKNPTDDCLSQLVMARDGQDRLSTEEIYGMLYVALIAGHDTTMNTMGLGVVALANNSEARAQLLSGEGDLTAKLMELMRYVAMSSAQPRVASEDFEWNGHHIKAGDAVMLMIAGANRDPNVFADPEHINFQANPTDKVLSFGTGRHHCIGHFLAKMQLEEFFPAFFGRFDVKILDEQLEFWPVYSQRGLKRLNLELTPHANA